jgi:hypothetical protein
MDQQEPNWRISSFCASGGCVEVGATGNAVLVRDSKNADSPILTFSQNAWSSFVAGIRAGDFTPEGQ